MKDYRFTNRLYEPKIEDAKKISDEVVRDIAEDCAINKCILRLLVKVIIIVLQISNLLFM